MDGKVNLFITEIIILHRGRCRLPRRIAGPDKGSRRGMKALFWAATAVPDGWHPPVEVIYTAKNRQICASYALFINFVTVI